MTEQMWSRHADKVIDAALCYQDAYEDWAEDQLLSKAIVRDNAKDRLWDLLDIVRDARS